MRLLKLNEAADFYDHESLGLGSLFLEEVERTLDFTTENQSAFVRRRKVKTESGL
jgi:hypothetical protein